MKKTLFIFPLAALLILLGVPRAASAKGPTVKITISGGGLTRAIEVTDPRILRISNVWLGQFLDGSLASPKEPPAGLRPMRFRSTSSLEIATQGRCALCTTARTLQQSEAPFTYPVKERCGSPSIGAA